jgi:hypothetical protein
MPAKSEPGTLAASGADAGGAPSARTNSVGANYPPETSRSGGDFQGRTPHDSHASPHRMLNKDFVQAGAPQPEATTGRKLGFHRHTVANETDPTNGKPFSPGNPDTYAVQHGNAGGEDPFATRLVDRRPHPLDECYATTGSPHRDGGC